MHYYTGFFIDEPLGNNIFSYSKRKVKKIYIPPLKQGTVEDVKISDNIAFCEIEDEKEIKANGLDCFIEYNLENKKIYIFDNHNHAFYFWVKSLKQNHFNKGCKLVHIDQHKDMREPEEYIQSIESLKEVFEYTNYKLNVGNFIKPALNLGIFSDVLIIDSLASFKLDINDEFVLDIDLDIFSKDMDYIDYDFKMNKIKQLIKKSNVITIATSPFFIDQTYAIKILREIFS
ncbi:UPF0489 domain-containing protein [Alkalithermobacter thermoalcaliphilus JW-YL-7 = DSM 7308]|uniref:UPF0489 domain-containing protein n=1 Tax=Alkalithermobacter thermoalcaliphilus JW-YL-7 = DSM 7308 TaxID=1121328 RepID=A0A150FSS1_CLOPD|nr:putative protein family UPF0489 [[Clostridium] paradoxum JW-YL-7 = DSM 7308]SHL18788.1 UPF0489 domain-containing protein [[Clostridium] paradoxum JW-YL-7 = DSM 7308]